MEETGILEEEVDEYDTASKLARIASIQSATLEAEYIAKRGIEFSKEE